MYLDDQEKEWLKAIYDKDINDVKSFIEKYCETTIENGNSWLGWAEFIIDKKNMKVPKNEDSFLLKLNSFTRLIEKMFSLGLLNFSFSNVSKNELLPIFRKGEKGFPEVYELLKKYQGYKLLPNQVFNDFINNNFLTEQDKRYYDEQESRKSSQRWTRGIAIAAILAQVITGVTLFYLESNREKEMTDLNQELSYYNAVAQKKISASEDIIRFRQEALDWLNLHRTAKSNIEKKQLSEKWYVISDKLKVSNSVSLIYSHQPYNAIMNFDDQFRDLTFKSNSLNDSLYHMKREELGSLFQTIIDVLRENTVGDSAYIIYQSKKHLDTERIKLK